MLSIAKHPTPSEILHFVQDDKGTCMVQIRRRRGQRNIRLCVHTDGRVTVSAGLSAPQRMIEAFVRENAAWIERAQARMAKLKPGLLARRDRAEYLAKKEEARELARSRLEYFNQVYGFRWNRISIKDQRSQWGSCSRSGNLNFNYKIVLLPPALADYVIVHELCHLKEMNHSARYWSLVSKTVPDWRERRSKLRRYGTETEDPL
ncbi:M48 family peptidase [Candidatus Uhrbacteria bacterium]|nr:MAG: M48 family peptidase [Candidatus Uhrbacteria bacterium]